MLGATHDFEELIDAVKEKYDLLKRRYEFLKEENTKLKDKVFEKEYVARLQEKHDKMLRDYLRGFPLSEEDAKKIKKWQEEHKKSCKQRCYGYRFFPTPLGVSGSIWCSCGAHFEFQEIG